MSDIVFIIGFNYDSNCFLINKNILVDTGAGHNKDYLFSKLRENDVEPEDIELVVNTHCHFDHLMYVPELLEEGEATVFCTEQCCRTMERYTDQNDRMVCVRPGNEILLGGVQVDVLKGKHIEFQYSHFSDSLSLSRLVRYARNLPSLVWANRSFKEAGEIVAYRIRAEEREILLLGSLALDENETYPEGVDILVLPYQGNNDLTARAREVLGRIRPKSILLSHFDNAFPPLSRHMDLKPLRKLLDEEFPEIRAVLPTAFRPLEF
jgi:L-ascorbate metabolism protein UlaG (beta-lactamase superfamily)